MAYQTISQRRYKRRTASAWAAQQHHMACAGMALLWLLGAAGALVVLAGSIAGGAWLAMLLGIGV